MTSGLETASVTSVCPPHREMPQAVQICWMSRATASTSDPLEPEGNSSVLRNHRGVAPLVATSLALASTA